MRNCFKILLVVFLFVAQIVQAQDMHFTQFYAAPLYLNPALTGVNVCSRASLTYRNQWPGISRAYNSSLFSIDHYIHKYNLGVGLMIGEDLAGSGNLQTTIVYPSVAYELRFNRDFGLRFGVQPGIANQRINYDRLTFGDQIARGGDVSTIESSYHPKTYFDANTGVMLYTEKAWLGFSAFHINRPNESLTGTKSRLPIKYTLHGGYKFLLNTLEKDKMKQKTVSAAFHYRGQKKFDQFDIGMYYSENVFNIGLWYRGIPGLKKYKPGYSNNDAIAIIVGLKNKRTSFGYSYDITISKLHRIAGGAHEITISYQLCNANKRKKVRLTMDCPKF